MLAIASIVGMTHSTLAEQSTTSVLINLSGRQRMLNQRFVKETLQEQNGASNKSLKTLALLETSAGALLDGGDVPLGGDKFASVPALKDPEIRASFEMQQKLCLLYTSPSPRDQRGSRMPSSA